MSHAPKDARLAALPQAAARIVEALGLAPNPEGGWFAEVWRSPAPDGGRGALTTIYFLLARGERSHWHRVDAEEVWHHYAGAPLALDMAPDDAAAPRRHLLGFDPDRPANADAGRPVLVVPAGWWQAAGTLGDWTLVGCSVAPAFTFDGFELAAPGWAPGRPAGRPES